jgi:hypothetical protein
MSETEKKHHPLPTLVKSSSPILMGLDRLLEELQQQAQALRKVQVPGKRRREREEEEARPTPTLDDLDLFIGRLRQIKEWLQRDRRLREVVDTYMSQQMQAIEKRQTVQNVWLAVITTLAGAVLGWLSSALASPVTLWHLLFH